MNVDRNRSPLVVEADRNGSKFGDKFDKYCLISTAIDRSWNIQAVPLMMDADCISPQYSVIPRFKWRQWWWVLIADSCSCATRTTINDERLAVFGNSWYRSCGTADGYGDQCSSSITNPNCSLAYCGQVDEQVRARIYIQPATRSPSTHFTCATNIVINSGRMATYVFSIEGSG